MNFENYSKRHYGMNSYESVYFYTFHKCASSLFSNYVLRNIKGLVHVDYAVQISSGKIVGNVTFEEKSYVYGPIRLSADPMSPVYKKLVEPVSGSNFIREKIAIFLVRDPSDILVSAYYSFGYSHGFSVVKEIRERQEQQRSKIQSNSIDEYALASAHSILKNFETVDRLSNACTRSVVLKYEDMIDNWNYFVKEPTKYVDIKQKVLSKIYVKSRPRKKVDESSHRRSGRPGGFRSKLKGETITVLNATFESALERFQYDA